MFSSFSLFFFFQAEDGIRDIGVTGVQTCALPIWEMTTIGDPLFDLGNSLSCWTEPDDPEDLKEVLPSVVCAGPKFLTRREFMDLYAQRSGCDLSDMHFYQVFGYYRLAVIIQQIYARWYRGQTKDERFASFGERVKSLFSYAHGMV